MLPWILPLLAILGAIVTSFSMGFLVGRVFESWSVQRNTRRRVSLIRRSDIDQS
jgi:hypothetical protein